MIIVRKSTRRNPLEQPYYLSLPIWLPITLPTAAPPTAPIPLPPVSTAPTAAPIAVFLSRRDMPLQLLKLNTTTAAITPTIAPC